MVISWVTRSGTIVIVTERAVLSVSDLLYLLNPATVTMV